MNKKIALFICIALLMLPFSGCKLAREDGLEGESSRLVGMYITREYLDLFDFEGYIESHISTLNWGGEITIDPDSEYAGRLYAVLQPAKPMNGSIYEYETQIYAHYEYVFDTVKGVPFYMVKVTQPDGSSYGITATDNAISDGHVVSGNNSSLSGTIYVTPDNMSMLYFNPVYQSSDGAVYMESGSGFTFSGDISEGTVYGQTMNESYTVKENGKEQEESFEVAISVAVKIPPEKIVVTQMNATHSPVRQEEYMAAALPEEVVVAGDTAYVVVEAYKMVQGALEIERSLYTAKDGSFTIYTARESGFCEANWISLSWEE